MTFNFKSNVSVTCQVNVVRGLKLFEDIFTPNEISKLNDLVDELRVAGQNGDLSGGSCDSWHFYS